MIRRSSIAMLARASLAFVFVNTPTAAARAENAAGMKVRAAQTWTVSQAPQGAWDVYLTAERLAPGFWTGPHAHPGPEYALIIKGEIQQWDHGTRHEVKTGDGYFIPQTWSMKSATHRLTKLSLSRRTLFRGGKRLAPRSDSNKPQPALRSARQGTRGSGRGNSSSVNIRPRRPSD